MVVITSKRGLQRDKVRIPYLDGLRALSIITVLLGHAEPSVPWLHTRFGKPFTVLMDGRLGVRVFFVLSGFLITTLLLEECHTTGKISLIGFYERRLARIFPAFYTFISCIVILKCFNMIDLSWKSLISAATFTWNYSYLWGARTMQAQLILEHTWTLSLEEQFYLLWPACLTLLRPKLARRLALLSVLLIPLVRGLQPSSLDPRQILMMFHTGADQIMWGVLVAFSCRRGTLDRFRCLKYRNTIPWFCAFVVYVFCPLLEVRFRWTGVIVQPTLDCFFISVLIMWLLSGEGGILRWTLESWPLIQLGLLSYSMYIWQQLFMVWPGMSFIKFPLNLLAVLLVGIASYRFVEIPMRKRIRQRFSQDLPAQ